MTESAKTRYTAVAKYFEGKTLDQIAADLGFSWRTEPSRSGLYNWRLRRATLSASLHRESTDTSASLVQGGPSVRPGVDRETSYEILY